VCLVPLLLCTKLVVLHVQLLLLLLGFLRAGMPLLLLFLLLRLWLQQLRLLLLLLLHSECLLLLNQLLQLPRLLLLLLKCLLQLFIACLQGSQQDIMQSAL
jgi:hypothetical protein